MLKALEENTKYQQFTGKDKQLLERFLAPDGAALQIIINAPEFTCLCPKTGQPDFGTIVIDYRPGDWCVESKSLKLYLMSFRMEGSFHEECVYTIGTALVELLHPHALSVEGLFGARGGIAFHPTYRYVRS